MFNEDIKVMFISENINNAETQARYINIFKTTEEVETKYYRDIAEMTAEQLSEVINEFNAKAAYSISTRIASLRKYILWCYSAGIFPKNDAINHVDVDTSDKIRKSMVANPTQLQLYLNKVFKPENDLSIDNTYRCYFWLAFAGMPEEEIINVTSEEVLLAEQIVVHNDMEYQIYKESVKAFVNCKTLTEFKRTNGVYVVDESRVAGSFIMRGTKAQAKIDTLRITLSKKCKAACDNNETGIRLSYRNAFLSGMFYRMSEMERAGICIDFVSIANAIVNDRDRSDPKDAIRHYKRFIKDDYNSWKNAFGI